jgi:transposase
LQESISRRREGVAGIDADNLFACARERLDGPRASIHGVIVLVAAELEALDRSELIDRLCRLAVENNVLKQQREALLRRIYGQRSEKLDPDQLKIFQDDLIREATSELEAEQSLQQLGASQGNEEPSRAKKPHRGRAPLPRNIPRKRREYPLPPEQRMCQCCNVPMEPFGEEVTEEIEYEPATVLVIEHVRPKYACRSCERGVAIAPLPDRPIEKGRPGPGLLAHVAVSKFADHLPLYRLEQIFERQGLELSRKTLCDWIARTAELVEPVVSAMKASLLREPLLQSDDTVVPYQNPLQPGKTSRGYLWAYTKPGAEVVFEFTPGRSREGPLKFLEGFRGHLQADGYSGYNELFRTGHVEHIACMAHVRRKIFEARVEDRRNADLLLAAIQTLYRIERKAKEDGVTGDTLVALRKAEALPLMEQLYGAFAFLKGKTLPKSLLGGAVRYAIEQWPAMMRYTDVAEARIDNNSCEQVIRTVCIGRKNWLFAGSIAGGERAATIYSLTVSCKRLGVEPFAYLRDVIERVSAHPMSRIEELTPRGWQAARTLQTHNS